MAPASAGPGGAMPPVQTMAPMPNAAPPARDGRALRATRTATGYTLSGRALVKDACQAARFDPSLLTIYPPQFNLAQFRRPGTMGMLCIQKLTWVTAGPRTVASQKPPAYVTVRTQLRTYRVPIR